jgi:hypothetical protein
MLLSFNVLKAKNGDCLMVSWDFDGKRRNILIDGGTSAVYKRHAHKGNLFAILERLKQGEERVDLLILTHVDDDHIGGILEAFKPNQLLRELCDEVWFNSGKLIEEFFSAPSDPSHELIFDSVRSGTSTDNYTSIKQGVSFESVISELNIWDRQIIHVGQVFEKFGATFTILSPTIQKLEKLLIKWGKEAPSSLTSGKKTDYGEGIGELLADDVFQSDKSIHNGSSIALLFEKQDKRLLLLGDAHDDVLVDSIQLLKDKNGKFYSETNPLPVDFVKLSHHGSQYNTSPKFLKLIATKNFIISTNGSKHPLPNKRALARIITQTPDATLFFNYDKLITEIFNPFERQKLHEQGVTLTNCDDVIEL